ncbi:MAG: sigma-54-dependent Fis family transcriptional regulator [Calditrichaeota bacterium]|nr:sigma-54-dependent Fis family transcriptional regulator [Calditrichota bacterium]
MSRRQRKIEILNNGADEYLALDKIISRSLLVADIKRLIEQIAPSDITVLISGESGVGKELFARAIHQLSRRNSGPLVTLNCGAIPEGIFESEIFGHEKGSFTSADRQRQGYFEMADKGTLFLDEIGEMPLAVQVKLLRVLETGAFLRVGGSDELAVDVRIIAATNKDLENEVLRGRFRQDLFYRLKAVHITVPPLRERSEDIPILIEQFARDYAERNQHIVPTFEPKVVEVLQRQIWTGNIRELKNFVESVIALSPSLTITLDDIYRRLPVERSKSNLPMVVTRSVEELDHELLYRTLLELRVDMSVVKNQLQQLIMQRDREVKFGFTGAEEVETYTLDEIEREQIQKALEQHHGNRRSTAQALGIGERTLYRKIKKYGII